MLVDLGNIDALAPGGRTCVRVGERRVVVFNLDGELHALDAACVHTGGPLEDGVVSNGVVTCPWHLHRYEIATGRRIDMSGRGQEVFPVSVENGSVVVDVPDQEPPKTMRERLLDHAREWERDQ